MMSSNDENDDRFEEHDEKDDVFDEKDDEFDENDKKARIKFDDELRYSLRGGKG